MATKETDARDLVQILINGDSYHWTPEIKNLLFDDNVEHGLKMSIIAQLSPVPTEAEGHVLENPACVVENTSQFQDSPAHDPAPPTDQVMAPNSSNEEAACSSGISTQKRWSDNDEKLLVETRFSMESDFMSNKSHSILWGRIVAEMAKHGVIVSPKQAADKWKNLKKKYNETVDMNRKTGSDKTSCRHFSKFSELYGNKASTKPHFTIDTDVGTQSVESSSKESDGEKKQCQDGETSERDQGKGKKLKKKIVTKKRPANTHDKLVSLIEATDKKNDEFRNAIVQQGEKKIKLFDKFLEIYEKKK